MATKQGNGVKVFIENVECDLGNHENNNSKPFYIVCNCLTLSLIVLTYLFMLLGHFLELRRR